MLRDVAQFIVMLVLVRLLSPSDYGTAAIAQAIIGFVSVVSYNTFSLQALQVRDPSTIDWQAHFSAAMVINIALGLVVLLVAWGLAYTDQYREVALPLAVLSVGFLVEIPGTLRHRMLETIHDWKRYRVLLMIGTVLALGVGLIVGLMGGGVWALVVQPPLLGLPAAFDILVLQRFGPRWTLNLVAWRELMRFGADRAASGLVARGRALNEQALLSSVYDLATLGVFTRANGLATLLGGRIGSVVPMALHPVVTRAERASPRFQRLAALVLRGVCWTTVPSAVFLAIAAQDIVSVLYGPKWERVVPLLPLAAFWVGITGIWNTLSGLLVANGDSRPAVLIDISAAASAVLIAFLVISFGPEQYLMWLTVHSLLIAAITIMLLVHQRAMTRSDVVWAVLPAFVGALVAGAAVVGVHRNLEMPDFEIARLALDGGIVAIVYVATLRLLFARTLSEILEVVPAGRYLRRALMLSADPTK